MEVLRAETAKKVESLEKLSATIVNIEDNVKKVKKWTEESAPASMVVIQSSTASPNERTKVSEELQGQASSNVTLVDELIENVDKIIGWFRQS